MTQYNDEELRKIVREMRAERIRLRKKAYEEAKRERKKKENETKIQD